MMGKSSLLPWVKALYSHGKELSITLWQSFPYLRATFFIPMDTSLFPWPIVSIPMGLSSLFPWARVVHYHTQELFITMGKSSLFPWAKVFYYYEQHFYITMGKSSLLWARFLYSHWQEFSNHMEKSSLFP